MPSNEGTALWQFQQVGGQCGCCSLQCHCRSSRAAPPSTPVQDCQDMCDTVSGCIFVNAYHDSNDAGKVRTRAASLTPVLELYGNSTMLTCSLFSKCLDARTRVAYVDGWAFPQPATVSLSFTPNAIVVRVLSAGTLNSAIHTPDFWCELLLLRPLLIGMDSSIARPRRHAVPAPFSLGTAHTMCHHALARTGSPDSQILRRRVHTRSSASLVSSIGASGSPERKASTSTWSPGHLERLHGVYNGVTAMELDSFRISHRQRHRDVQPDVRALLHPRERYFTHATPTLFNAGTPHAKLSSCFLVCMKDDSIEDIYDMLKNCAMISKTLVSTSTTFVLPDPTSLERMGGNKRPGAIAIYLEPWHAEDDSIEDIYDMLKNCAMISKTLVSTSTTFVLPDPTSLERMGGNKRPGAIAIYLEPWHADVFEFIDLRKNHGKEQMRARDLFLAFMKRVEAGAQWSLFCPNEAWVARGRSCAQDTSGLEAIPEAQVETGGPFMLYKDVVNFSFRTGSAEALKKLKEREFEETKRRCTVSDVDGPVACVKGARQ
ncbi:hypothetical protein GGX14DRAFT_654807 [Mycena pura]|uniref:Ribonucleotide reductase large subunit C-terminal domain-containing protein n=1 Tax=Mycena pura TaxID=153505 RepID=A0AAD6YCC4_9AGAR|nr:hypothetical protein GGX14DRAFT_654807 [Mycena pura]